MRFLKGNNNSRLRLLREYLNADSPATLLIYASTVGDIPNLLDNMLLSVIRIIWRGKITPLVA
jgi:hypothetical protein